MSDMTTANWVIVAGIVILALVLVWWLLGGSRRTRIERSGEGPSEGLPARRNQARSHSRTVASRLAVARTGCPSTSNEHTAVTSSA